MRGAGRRRPQRSGIQGLVHECTATGSWDFWQDRGASSLDPKGSLDVHNLLHTLHPAGPFFRLCPPCVCVFSGHPMRSPTVL